MNDCVLILFVFIFCPAYDPISMFRCKGTFVGHQVNNNYNNENVCVPNITFKALSM